MVFADFFLFQLLCSFVAGAFVVAGATWAAERFQTRWGGFIAAIPTTTAVSLVFIAWTQGNEFAARAANVTPAAVAGSLLFALVFVKTALRGGRESKEFVFPLAAGLASWLAIALLVVSFKPSIWVSILVFIPFFALFFASLTLKKHEHKKFAVARLTARETVFRAVLGGCVITGTVLLARAFGEAWGGVAGTFPAVFASSLAILTRRNGAGFAEFFAKDFSFGIIANCVFLVGVALLLPSLGFAAGFAASYAIGLLAALAFYAAFKSSPRLCRVLQGAR